MDIGQTDSIAEEIPRSQFLCLPPEIHEHIFRYCGVSDIQSLALVNHFLNNIVRSKLRDLLIAACQNGIVPMQPLLSFKTTLTILIYYTSSLTIPVVCGK